MGNRYAGGSYRVAPSKGMPRLDIEIGADDLRAIEPKIPWTDYFFPDNPPGVVRGGNGGSLERDSFRRNHILRS